jgi:hypothetical protein
MKMPEAPPEGSFLRLVMPAQAGIQGREGGWIPACAGMTEQSVIIDAQIIAARRVFSKEDTSTKEGTSLTLVLSIIARG